MCECEFIERVVIKISHALNTMVYVLTGTSTYAINLIFWNIFMHIISVLIGVVSSVIDKRLLLDSCKKTLIEICISSEAKRVTGTNISIFTLICNRCLFTH